MNHYDVRRMMIERRFIGEQPVECLVFWKTDHTATVVRLTPEQMADLQSRISHRLSELTDASG